MLSRTLRNLLAGFLLVFSSQVARGAFASSSFQVHSATHPRPSGNKGTRCASVSTSRSWEGDASEDIPRGGGSGSLPKSLPSLPTLAQYRKFAIPCLALWVSGPLLSLVDTSFVGLSGSSSQSAQQLAALGPATTFFDGR